MANLRCLPFAAFETVRARARLALAAAAAAAESGATRAPMARDGEIVGERRDLRRPGSLTTRFIYSEPAAGFTFDSNKKQ